MDKRRAVCVAVDASQSSQSAVQWVGSSKLADRMDEASTVTAACAAAAAVAAAPVAAAAAAIPAHSLRLQVRVFTVLPPSTSNEMIRSGHFQGTYSTHPEACRGSLQPTHAGHLPLAHLGPAHGIPPRGLCGCLLLPP